MAMIDQHKDIPVTPAEDEAFEEILRRQVAEDPEALSEEQRAYIDADRYFQSHVKPFLDDFKGIRSRVVERHGVGSHWRDPEGTVYEVVQKKGQWVDFFPYEIHRTRRGGEAKGSLSLTRARELGYEV